MALLDQLNEKRPEMQKKKALFHQDNAPCPKSKKKDSQTECIALQITFPPTVQSRTVPQRLLATCRPKKNAPRKEVWLK
ncbi:hypothetical protein TNCV_719141 [Trichonephila clavipes]|nr:hypothetical protein TNCV_719141 [Trichonephila clavipes]